MERHDSEPARTIDVKSTPASSKLSYVNWAVSLILAVGLAVLSVIFAYYATFGNFASYDDEGCLMMTIKLFKSGHKLYDEVISPYGPTYFCIQSFLHTMINIPLNDDSRRLMTVFVWITASAIPTVWVWVVTRRASLSAMTYFLIFFYLSTLKNGPGHPQELCLLLVEAAVSVPLLAGGRRHLATAIGSGILASALVLTKINIGVFLSLSIVLSFMAVAGQGKFWRALRLMITVAAVCLPFVLVRGHLPEKWAIAYASTISLSIAAITVTSSSLEPRPGRNWLLPFAIAFLLTTIILVLFPLANGTSLQGLVGSLILTPLRLSKTFAFPIGVPRISIVVGLLSLIMACFHARFIKSDNINKYHKYESLFCLLKIAFAVMIMISSFVYYELLPNWFSSGMSQDVLSYGTLFLWLGLMPFPAIDREPEQRHFRVSLCFISAIQALQIFPVPVDQYFFGTFLQIVVAMVCLGDALDWLECLHVKLPFRTMLRRLVLPSVLAGLVGVLVYRESKIYRAYQANVPIGANGASRLRVPEIQSASIRWLIANIDHHSETFFSSVGFNSLYFWTNKPFPGAIVQGNEIDVATLDQQTKLVNYLSQYPGLCVVYHQNFSGRPSKTRTFLDYIDHEFETLGTFDGFDFRVRNGRVVSELFDCAVADDDQKSEINAAGSIDARSRATPTTYTAVLNIEAVPGRMIDRICLYDVESKNIIADSSSTEPSLMMSILNGDIGKEPSEFIPGRIGLDLSTSRRLKLRFTPASDLKSRTLVRLYDRDGRLVKSLPFLERRSHAAR